MKANGSNFLGTHSEPAANRRDAATTQSKNTVPCPEQPCEVQGAETGNCSKDGNDDQNGTQDSLEILEKEREADFLAYVRGSPAPKIHMPTFEVPEFLDIEAAMSNKAAMHQMMQSSPHIEVEPEQHGLISLLDGTISPEAQKLMDDMEPKVIPTKRKNVTFADQQQKRNKKTEPASTLTPSKYRTRSAARTDDTSTTDKEKYEREITASATTSAKSSSPRRSPRFKQSPAVTETCLQGKSSRLSTVSSATDDYSGPKTTTTTPPSSADRDSMNRKLVFDSTESEREEMRKRAMQAPDAPPFNLDTPPDDNEIEKNEADQHDTQAERKKPAAGASAKSITSVAQEYQKRLSKPGKFQRSPFIDYELKKNYNVTLRQSELYHMVCEHAGKIGDRKNDNAAVDIGTFFVSIANLADSVAPRRKLVNLVAEIAIHIINEENQNPRKFVMPLRIASYLIDGRFDQREVLKCFEATDTNRLDHKETICFPALQKFTRTRSETSGHYWLVVLNIQAERFEIIDSLGRKGEPLMLDDCHLLIAGIKTMWAYTYKDSNIQIHNWPIEVLDCPRQNNTFDCGFFTLKNIEGRHGRKIAAYDQTDMPNIRILYTDKWLRWPANNAKWRLHI